MAAQRSVREVESEATRQTILEAAEGLLAAGGEDGLSIRELCARAGVTPPTIYHHFGHKRALVDRVIDDCFAEFDGALARRTPPADPVEALRWAFDRYVEYGLAHPTHYRVMFQRTTPRKSSAAGLASYDRLRRVVAAVAAAGRLVPPVEIATLACWCAAHGVTSLLVGAYFTADDPGVALVRDGLIAQLTTPPSRARRARRQKRSRA
ncbi:MAG TPA: TetR/AcrR family transcriptional regulator [Candidatus Binatia bacterium]|nr:TetR/AcrR family transcriptional regulator [Candidatus Binatia bacterium]